MATVIKSMNDALTGAKPFSSVSVWFDRLTSNAFKEDDYEGIPELVESINLQSSGPTEASRCVRKKLKYGSVHGQKRALTILGALVENAGPRFQTSFADERLVNQIKLTAADPLVDAGVRRKLMRLLLSWQVQFSQEPTMRAISGLYVACGGGREKQEREAQRKRSEAEELLRKQEEERKREMQVRMDRKTAERIQKEEDKKRKKDKSARGAGGAPRRFDYEKEKPQILSHLATSSRSATNLVNALQHVNREKESVVANVRVQQALSQVKAERKAVVRYIQLCQDEEMLGALIEANDRIMIALQLYDKLSKPSTSDSEDDEQLAAVASTKATAAQKAAAEDAEIEAVRQRLAAADLDEGDAAPSRRTNAADDDWEGEIEKLQFKQRRGIDRHNSRRGGVAGGGAGAVQDLLDLDFDDTASASVGPSLRPHNRAASGAGAGAGGSRSVSAATAGGGTLSDYSDYDSSEDEGVGAGPGAGAGVPPGAAAAAAAAGTAGNTDHGAALKQWRQSKTRPFARGIGEETASLWSKEDEERWIRGDGEEEDDEEEGDPFGDEWEEVADRLRSSGAGEPRREWAAV